MSPDIVKRAQTTEYLNRVYKSRIATRPQVYLVAELLGKGDKSPAYPRDMSSLKWLDQDRVTDEGPERQSPDGKGLLITRLGYGQGEVVEQVGFWYYIFGEASLRTCATPADYQQK